MAHSQRESKGTVAKGRLKKGEQFDPEELCRRLTAHLGEQKLRRDARAAKAAAARQNSLYHHEPKFAAASFERTTSTEVRGQSHRLSQPALKKHRGNSSIDDPKCQLSTLQKNQALDKALVEQDLLRNRNQFQWNRVMKEAANADLDRNVYKPPRRTFRSDVHLKDTYDRGSHSTGEIFSEKEEDGNSVPTKTDSRPKTLGDFGGRNEWAQQDKQTREIKDKTRPILRKRDSIWIMKGKKDRKSKEERDEVTVDIGDPGTPPDGSKSGKAGFLARFKRHAG